jgi:hypothetical protein
MWRRLLAREEEEPEGAVAKETVGLRRRTMSEPAVAAAIGRTSACAGLEPCRSLPPRGSLGQSLSQRRTSCKPYRWSTEPAGVGLPQFAAPPPEPHDELAAETHHRSPKVKAAGSRCCDGCARQLGLPPAPGRSHRFGRRHAIAARLKRPLLGRGPALVSDRYAGRAPRLGRLLQAGVLPALRDPIVGAALRWWSLMAASRPLTRSPRGAEN